MSRFATRNASANSSFHSGDYQEARGIISDHPFDEPPTDVTDRPSSKPIHRPEGFGRKTNDIFSFGTTGVVSSSSNNEFERKYYTEVEKNRQLEGELREARDRADRHGSDQSGVKSRYEEFIARLTRENEALRGTEEQLMKVTATKKSLEVELERVSALLKAAKSSGENEVVEELKAIIQRLNIEKSQLRSQLEDHKNQLSELVTNITTIRETSSEDARRLQQQLEGLQMRYDDLERRYREEKSKPIRMPDDSALKELLQERLRTIESLQNRIRFLDTELVKAQNRPCPVCPSKDRTITSLNNRVRDLENRPLQTKIVEVREPRPVVVRQASPVVCRQVLPTVRASPVRRVCQCRQSYSSSRCPLCGCERGHSVGYSSDFAYASEYPACTCRSIRNISPLRRTFDERIVSDLRNVGPRVTRVVPSPSRAVQYEEFSHSPVTTYLGRVPGPAVTRNFSPIRECYSHRPVTGLSPLKSTMSTFVEGSRGVLGASSASFNSFARHIF